MSYLLAHLILPHVDGRHVKALLFLWSVGLLTTDGEKYETTLKDINRLGRSSD